jgi:hypothetical protein
VSRLTAQAGSLIAQADGQVSNQARIVAVVVTVLLLMLVIELVRRRRLVERYALLWIVAAVALLVLAVWRGALDLLREISGAADPVNALFLIAFAVVFVLLLHFSVAISRLSEEAKILAQENARLDAELRDARRRERHVRRELAAADQGEGESPVGGEQPAEQARAPGAPEKG